MKKPILIIALAVLFIPGIILTSCKSSTQKAEDAKENVQDAREDLQEAKQDANTAVVRAANEQEWKEFRIDVDAKIKKNELRISELKTQQKNAADKQRIVVLEERNNDLKSRMNDYENNKGDWESFTREFNQSMNELDNELKADNR